MKYCSNCNAERPENAMFCNVCGQPLTNDKTEIQIQQEAELTNESASVENQEIEGTDTVFNDENEENVSLKITDKDGDYTNGVAVNSESQSSNTTKSLSPKIFIILIVVIAVIGVIVGYSHFNSATYKINKATELVLSQSYDEALKKISDVYTSQAEVIRNYISLEKSKEDFMKAFDSSKVVTSYEDEMFDKLNSFTNKVSSFADENDIYLLPQELRENYDYYSKAVNAINNTGVYWEELINAQNVFLNEVTCNRESEFTLNQLQENVDSSKEAVENLKNAVDEIPDITSELSEHIDFSNDTITTFKDLFDRFIFACESEILSSQAMIDRDAEKFNMDDSLYRKEPDENYTAYITYDLKEIINTSDSSMNANTIYCTLKVELLAFYLSN